MPLVPDVIPVVTPDKYKELTYPMVAAEFESKKPGSDKFKCLCSIVESSICLPLILSYDIYHNKIFSYILK